MNKQSHTNTLSLPQGEYAGCVTQNIQWLDIKERLAKENKNLFFAPIWRVYMPIHND